MTVSNKWFLLLFLILTCLPAQAWSGVTLFQRWDGTTKGDGYGFFIGKLHDNGSGDSVSDPRQDGTPDIFIGKACNGTNCPVDEGNVSVYSGKDFSLIFRITGKAWSYAQDAGDLNGDGVSDILVSESFPADPTGRVRAFSGSDGTQIQAFAFLQDTPWSSIAASISSIGDITGDGVPDLIAGNSEETQMGVGGYVVLLSGSDGSLITRIDNPDTGNPFAGFGHSVSSAGDLNGDGVGDFIVTSPGANPNGITNAGSIYIFNGATGKPFPRFDGQGIMRLDGESSGDYLGGSPDYGCGWVDIVGDLNGDGYPDFITGAPGTDINGVADAGRLLVFSGYDTSVLLRIDNPDPAYTPHYFGESGAVVRDINGKLPVKIVVGAGDPFYGTPETGSVYLFNLSNSRDITSTNAVIYSGATVGVPGKIITAGNKIWMTNSTKTTLQEKLATGNIHGKVFVVEDAGDPQSVRVEIYDPVMDTWKTAPPMSYPRSGAATGVAGNFLYIIGGFDGSGPVATVEVYDPVTKAWTTKTPMSSARIGASVNVVGDFLYVIGGTDSRWPIAAVEAYDPVSNAWTTKPSLSRNNPPNNPMTSVTNGVIYCVWPAEGGGLLMDAFDPVAGVWANKAPLYKPMTNPVISVEHGTLYFSEGELRNDGIQAVDAFDPVSNSWHSKGAYVY